MPKRRKRRQKVRQSPLATLDHILFGVFIGIVGLSIWQKQLSHETLSVVLIILALLLPSPTQILFQWNKFKVVWRRSRRLNLNGQIKGGD